VTLFGTYLTDRRIRLIGGMILFVYITTHFLNHALGLISLQAMEEGRRWFLALWRNPVGSIALYGSLLLHFILALWAVYQRRRLMAMPRAEALQLLLGLSIVPLLAQHVIGTRGAHEWSGTHDSYTYVVLTLYHFAPEKGLWQTAALLVAWGHGCLGLHFWLRLRLWYPRFRSLLNAAALLIPVFGLIGFLDGGREASRLAADPEWLRMALAAMNLPSRAALAELQALEMQVYWWFAGLLALTLAAREVRALVERHRGLVRITYPGGREIETIPGPTILEVSQLNGIPHASVCGGRGRCSTCRVRVTLGLDDLPPASTGETAVLARVGAAPNVRLACQVRPTSDITIVPLLPSNASPREARARPAHLQGREKEIAILFADLRGFTMLSEKKLPYDVVFMLNRYFAAMGQAVETAGGHVDKFIGDGVMALFGTGESTDTRLACRQAIEAARGMSLALDTLNKTLMHDLEKPLRIGIGIHVGPAIVGEMGYAGATTLTAIGDAVNTASRLESMTKEFGCELVLSEDVARYAGLDLSMWPVRETEIRGRSEKLKLSAVAKAHQVPDPGREALVSA
jgi:adenylate cyclase